ncbi:MAG: hypothetical protein J6S85_16700 [Methanobrevibacter sp.]|nr:hypothetical protein [Methanobrevibacter sp.]
MKKIIILVLVAIVFSFATEINNTIYSDFMNGMGKCEFSVSDDSTEKFFTCEHGYAVFWIEQNSVCMDIIGIDNIREIFADDSTYEDLKAEKVDKFFLCFKGNEKKKNMRFVGRDNFGVDIFDLYFKVKTTIYELYRMFKLITMK